MNAVGSATHRPLYGRIIGHCSVRLWGLTSAERLERQCRSIAAIQFLSADDSVRVDGSVLLLRADYLYEPRTLQALVDAPEVALRASAGNAELVAAHVPAARAAEVEAAIESGGTARLDGVAVKTPEELTPAYVRQLLKSERPVVLAISEERRALLERHLFDGSYKGITDLVTKWVWPAPARAVVRLCVRFGIRPNTVTLTSLVLVLAVLGLFGSSWYGPGLVLAWIMTFLDTVDGKLARVTIDSSRLGHALDKGIDLIHPPLWYIAWGVGLLPPGSGWLPDWLVTCAVLILFGYIAGRLLEGAFDFYLGKFPIYSWREVDSYVRLVIARRNPNLLWLTVFWLAGSPWVGLQMVVVWTLVSTVFLAVRVVMAARERRAHGELRSWLQDSGGEVSSFAARTFSSSAPARLRALESSS